MKPLASRLSSISLLILALIASAQLSAAAHEASQADATATVVVHAFPPGYDATTTIVVPAPKYSGTASPPLVLAVMMVFGSVLLLLRRRRN